MPKTTTRLYDVIKSEFMMRGMNEFKNKVNGKTQITTDNRNYRFMTKAMMYDEDTKNVTNEVIFLGYQLPSTVADIFFKKAFINKFLIREIGQQTIEAFSAELVGYLMRHEVEINELANNLADYYNGSTQSNEIASQNTASNSGTEDLPQDTFNYDLTKNSMPTASAGAMARGHADSSNQKTGHNYDPNVIATLHSVWDNIFKDIDRICFMQVI